MTKKLVKIWRKFAKQVNAVVAFEERPDHPDEEGESLFAGAILAKVVVEDPKGKPLVGLDVSTIDGTRRFLMREKDWDNLDRRATTL